MKRFSIHEWMGLMILVLIGFSSANGALTADPAALFLAGLTVAGLVACELMLRSRRSRQALPIVRGHWRN